MLKPALQDSVIVTSEAPLVQTTTSARNGQITRDNMEDIALKGRDVTALLVLLPGVTDTNPREAPSWTLPSGLSINGRTGISFSYDGINNRNTDGPSVLAAPGVDSIAEVRVQSSNFQAEYGRSSGAAVTTITRSGSSAFRGSAAFYKRDDSLNGNEYARRVQCKSGLGETCGPALYESTTSRGPWAVRSWCPGPLSTTAATSCSFSGRRTSVNTNAIFDYGTRELTNPAVFGSLTDATNSARRIQLAVRFTF